MPVFLPDGRHFTALRLTGPQQPAEVFVGALDSPDREPLLSGVDSPVRYVAPGYVSSPARALVAQRFDLGRRRLSGDRFRRAAAGRSVLWRLDGRRTGLPSGESAAELHSRLVRSHGQTTPQRDALPEHSGAVALARRETGGRRAHGPVRNRPLEHRPHPRDQHAVDRRRGPGYPAGAVARRHSGRVHEERKIIRKFSSGTAPKRSWPTARRPTGPRTEIHQLHRRRRRCGPCPSPATRSRFELVQTKGNDRRGRFSPDGKWIAYESNFSGRNEVYVQRFPPTAERVQVSVEGGGSAYWRKDSKELFFLGPDQRVMSVEITPGERSRPARRGACSKFPASSPTDDSSSRRMARSF